jgi:hypothetical protein
LQERSSVSASIAVVRPPRREPDCFEDGPPFPLAILLVGISTGGDLGSGPRRIEFGC